MSVKGLIFKSKNIQKNNAIPAKAGEKHKGSSDSSFRRNDGGWFGFPDIFFLTIMTLSLFFASFAHAACTDPAGIDGEIIYNSDEKVFQGCTIEGWQAFHAKPETTCPTDGLVAHWALNEVSGTTTAPETGGNYDGTLTNMDPATDWVSGKIGNALDFDGTDDSIEVSAVSGLQITAAITLNAWVYARTLSSSGRKILSKGESISGGLWEYRMGIYDDKVRFGVAASESEEYLSDWATSFPVGEWHMITGTYDGTDMHIYFDGTEKSSVAVNTTIGTNAGTIHIGNAYGGEDVNRTWDGMLDDVRIYNRALTPQEISQLYQGGTGCQ